MIKYPVLNSEIKAKSELKYAVDKGVVKIGQRFFIGEDQNPVTCVHIDNDKYIFSMDEIFKTAPHTSIERVLKEVYISGCIDGGKEIIPIDIIKDIDFLFVPTERQVTGKNENGNIEEDDDQFEWFKRGEAVRVKGYVGIKSDFLKNGEPCSWWLATAFGLSSYYCSVNIFGGTRHDKAGISTVGVPIFFQMTKGEE